MKCCSKCKIYKELSEFGKNKRLKDGFHYRCKSCTVRVKPKGTKWKVSLREEGKKHCGKCKEVKPFCEFGKNKRTFDKYQTTCRACKSELDKEYRKNNREILNNKKRIYYEKNKELHKKRAKNRVRDYKKEYSDLRKDSFRTFKYVLRNRTYSAFKNKGYKKSSKTQEMLGVDWEVCKAHIEKKFTEGMNWGNQGKWHIDHIIPLASAKNEEELMKLCHYKNLQPLWAEDNLKKSTKIQGQQTYFKL